MKFEIFQQGKSKKYYFNLKAGNGRVVLESQGYAAKQSVLNGIESVLGNCGDDDAYEKKKTTDGVYQFHLKAGSGRVVGSSHLYHSRATMDEGVALVNRLAPMAVVVDLTIDVSE